MAATPVDDHTEEFEQLAGLSALGVLEGGDQARFNLHVAQCERCRLMVRLDREALLKLPFTVPEMEPSPDFKARLMQRAADELSARDAGAAAPRPGLIPNTSSRNTSGERGNVIPFFRRPTIMRSLAAVFVVALVSVGAFSYENQPVAQVDLHGDAPGRATVVVRRSGAAELEMRDLPDPGPGYVYEAWIIAQDQQPVAAGVLPNGNASIPLQGDVRGKTVAITREPGRVNAPTSNPVMVGVVQS
ncbi:MAG TPA: anti-sigma factor [Chloroflexota bacterium]|nr:anti-sigma factor [Chloroflexota bacterium]